MRNPIRTIDHQTVSMKVDLGWITHEKMQHITSRIRRLNHFVSSSVQLQKQNILRRQSEREQEIGIYLIML